MAESYRYKAYKGFFSQTFITVVNGVLSLVYFSFMSRLLTKEEFGLYAVVTALLAITDSLSEAGLGSAVIQKKDADKGFVNTAFTLSIIVGIFFAVFTFVCAPFLSNITIKTTDLTTAIRIMSFSILLTSLVSVARATYMRKLNFLKYGFIQIAVYIISSAVGVILAIKHYGIYAPIIASLMNQVLLAIVLYWMAHISPKLQIIGKHVREIISYSGWLTGSVIIRVLNDQVDKLVMPRFLSVTLLGTYNRPVGFVGQLSGQFFGIFDTILFPILSDVQNDKNRVNSAYTQVFSLLILLSITFSACLILAADVIIDIFLGRQWEELETLLQLISVGVVLGAYRRISDCFFRSLGFVKQYFNFRCIASVVTIISVVVGCKFGIYGVASAILIANTIDAIMKIIYLNNKIGFSTLAFLNIISRSVFIPLLIFIPLYIIKMFVGVNSIICLIIFLGIWVAVAFARPKWLGDSFYNQIYKAYISKIIGKITNNR